VLNLNSGLYTTGAPNGIIAGVTITTNSTALGSVDSAINAGLVSYDLIGANPDHRNFSLGVDVAKFVDKPQILDDPQFFCTASSNPAQFIYAHVWAFDYSPVTYGTIVLSLEVEFDCIFTDPIPFS
jgi:hypothetical protein